MRLSEHQLVSKSLTAKAVAIRRKILKAHRTALHNLKPKSKIYRVFERDRMCVAVSPIGTTTFRYDYRYNGRRETLTLVWYGPTGMWLATARERLLDAKRSVDQGLSLALEKQRAKRRLTVTKSFGEMTGCWPVDARTADSVRAMWKDIIDHDILPVFQDSKLREVTPDDLLALCNKVKVRGAPAIAIRIRDILKPTTFFPRDRALSHADFDLPPAVQRLISLLSLPRSCVSSWERLHLSRK